MSRERTINNLNLPVIWRSHRLGHVRDRTFLFWTLSLWDEIFDNITQVSHSASENEDHFISNNGKEIYWGNYNYILHYTVLQVIMNLRIFSRRDNRFSQNMCRFRSRLVIAVEINFRRVNICRNWNLDILSIHQIRSENFVREFPNSNRRNFKIKLIPMGKPLSTFQLTLLVLILQFGKTIIESIIQIHSKMSKFRWISMKII